MGARSVSIDAGQWRNAGPFSVWLPEGLARVEAEAVGIRKTADPLMLACSRKEWMEFVAAVKRGEFDVKVI